MGVEDIIRGGQEDVPVHNLDNTDGASDEEDIPIAENIYSDASSDTEMSEDESDFSSLSPSVSSLIDQLQELEDLAICESLLDNTPNNVEESRPVVIVEPSTLVENSSAPSKKLKIATSKSASKSRQGVGKKKARRIENARQLDQMRGDDDASICDINDFMPVDCSFRFSQILEDIDLANKILNPSFDDFDMNYDFADASMNALGKKSKDCTAKRKKLSAQAAFNNLYASEKDLFRRRNLPMGMVQYLDTCVLSFFEENPTGTYVSEPLSSFERMMLHSIAHFYALNSCSFNAENFKYRLTKVTNSLDYFNPPYLCLSKYVERLTVKNSNSNFKKCKRFRRK